MTRNPVDSMRDEWRINNFDLVRLLAALQVALVHTSAYFKIAGPEGAIFEFGLRMFPGVPIFFVISGFLISKSLEHSTSITEFYRNRCLRIFPALWVCLVVSVCAVLASGARAFGTASAGDWLLWWAAQMSFFQFYTPDFLGSFGSGQLNSSLWTIPVELEFYLVLPVIYAWLRPRGGRATVLLAALAAASLAMRLAVADNSRIVLMTLAPHLWMFLCGVIAQRNWPAMRGWLANRFHWWLLGYLLARALLARYHVGLGSLEINPVLMPILAGVALSGAMSARTLSDRLLRRNDLSYGTYIYHMVVVNFMLQAGVPQGNRAVAIALAVSIGAAAISWKFVERPFLARKRGPLRAAAA